MKNKLQKKGYSRNSYIWQRTQIDPSLPALVQQDSGKCSDGFVLSYVPNTRLIPMAKSMGPYP